MEKPQVIFLDAVGTLFGVKGSVGAIYSQIAADFGVEVVSESLEQSFLAIFPNSPPLAFPDVEPAQIPQLEYRWWRSLTGAVFNKLGYLERFPDFEAFFGELYHHFATAEPWLLYEDVIPALRLWQIQGIELGIISNFDSRIYQVLAELGLEYFFRSITISSQTGAAKPDPEIFQIALQKHDCPPAQAWHIGDSKKEDYQGAKALGIEAFLIKR
ncbi:MAG: HAD family hydrolase [Microcystis sp. M_OC_Ca_00000000_S217Cul]|uniref:HAD-IA family hydrolase n=1 Tax=unclassified Microcystis TaxID=2643300 RepID=UPI001193DEB5|nr:MULTISPECIES: HAD-IA family hydrolase [unclassified Microcystis]TRT73154.1 MAG: HAD family hydrolase [Microcystis sp. M_OC_Ca_00000000_S217Cul]TRT93220.1 MAG: HAD family hydrolase [Microcystis sp. M_OC_Ca_00000000_C217Col]